MLWVRGLIFTLLVPVVIAVVIPRWIEPVRVLHGGWLRIGWIVIGVGAAFYFTCLLNFLRSGGTPAIFFTRDVKFLLGEEPKVLVRKGLYGISRNPMYVGVVATVAGQALIYGSKALAIFAAFLWLCFHVVVVLLEEPHLRAERGAAYDEYRREVPRWIGWPKRQGRASSCRVTFRRRGVRRSKNEYRRSAARAFEIQSKLRAGARD